MNNTSQPKNYVEHIHNYRWLERYHQKRITADSFIATGGRRCESLNGRWNYAVDQYATSLRAEWYKEIEEYEGRPIPPDYSFEGWDEMELPTSWNTAAEHLYLYEGYLAFTRTFRIETSKDERVYIKFEGAQYRAYIFLNKEYLGVHFGGSTPFVVEATAHLREDNRIMVVVDNTRNDAHLPMSNTDWFNYGGIYRDIELVRVPRQFIRNYRVHLVPDNTYSKIEVEVDVEQDGSAENRAEVSIPELGVTETIPLQNGYGSVGVNAHPELWAPDSPRLYDVTITFGEDTVTEPIGFRQISVQGTDVLLNGKKVFFRGVACHEDSLTGGKYLSEAEIRHDLETARELGCNYMRLAHYPHSSRTARIADEMGIMLWEEVPVYWAIDFTNPATWDDGSNQLRELIVRDWNRASVVIWSVGNENPDTDERFSFMSRLVEKTRNLDSTRLVSAACLVNHVENRIEDRLAEKLDIIGLNEYFGWYDPDYDKLPALFRNSNPDRPVFITEFGGGALAGHRGSINEFFTEDRQRHIYEEQIKSFRQIPYLKGISPWILFDFRCPRRTNVFQRGYNRKGLLGEDKVTRKKAFAVLQEFYREIADATDE
jgi:beta-glucuronidase